jgi:hypothetical protein
MTQVPRPPKIRTIYLLLYPLTGQSRYKPISTYIYRYIPIEYNSIHHHMGSSPETCSEVSAGHSVRRTAGHVAFERYLVAHPEFRPTACRRRRTWAYWVWLVGPTFVAGVNLLAIAVGVVVVGRDDFNPKVRILVLTSVDRYRRVSLPGT